MAQRMDFADFSRRVRRVGAALVLPALLLVSGGRAQAQAPCLTPLVDDEPLCNPGLADAEWPISHHGPYAQGSSPFAGPVAGQTVTATHLDLPGPPITLAMSPAYPDGHHALWAAVLGLSNAVVKIDEEHLTLLDSYVPANEEAMPPSIPLGVSGAYSMVDRDSNFLVGRARFVEIFSDSIAGDRSSPIALAKRVFLPETAFCRSDDLLVGGVLLADGHLALVTQQASVSVVPSTIADMEAANVVSLPSENGSDCENMGIASADLETVSNSIAADEDGGFYVATDAAVIKYRWDGAALHKVWRTEYLSDEPYSVLRLGPGSGSTPSLVGTALDDDRFVVITDGQRLMHLVLMWRDEIPADWEPIAPGRDPRIACEVPVNFGNEAATRSLSEQSVLVRGYANVVVSNLLRSEAGINTITPSVATAIAALVGGDPDRAPHGAQRIDWDPVSRTCKSVWTNSGVSLPNAIPTMSAATGMMHAIGQRDGVWGLETLDFETGASVRFDPGSKTACSQSVLDAVGASILGPFLSPVLASLPGSCENSFFAATEVGADGAIYTGTFQGVSRYQGDTVVTTSHKRAGRAGATQGVDLSARAIAALPDDPATSLDMARRGQVQMSASLAAVAAGSGGDIDAHSAGEAATLLAAAEGHFAAAEAAVGVDDDAAADEFAAAQADSALAGQWLTPCPPAPQSDCRTPGSASFALKVDGDKSLLKWSWKSADAVAAVPDPTTRADYGLCVYDADGTRRLAAALVPADASKWKAANDGFKFKDAEAANDGVKSAAISEKTGKAMAKMVGKGAAVPDAVLPATAPVTVQLVNSETGLCWGAEFGPSSISKNDATQLKATLKP